WVRDLIDIEQMGRGSAGDVLSYIISQIEKGELYVNNWSIAVVQRLGTNKGVIISETVNAESVEETSEGSEIINVVTVQGKDGLPLPTTYPNSVFRSEQSIAAYGERKGFLDFDDVEDPVQLLARTQYAFSP